MKIIFAIALTIYSQLAESKVISNLTINLIDAETQKPLSDSYYFIYNTKNKLLEKGRFHNDSKLIQLEAKDWIFITVYHARYSLKKDSFLLEPTRATQTKTIAMKKIEVQLNSKSMNHLRATKVQVNMMLQVTRDFDSSPDSLHLVKKCIVTEYRNDKAKSVTHINLDSQGFPKERLLIRCDTSLWGGPYHTGFRYDKDSIVVYVLNLQDSQLYKKYTFLFSHDTVFEIRGKRNFDTTTHVYEDGNLTETAHFERPTRVSNISRELHRYLYDENGRIACEVFQKIQMYKGDTSLWWPNFIFYEYMPNKVYKIRPEAKHKSSKVEFYITEDLYVDNLLVRTDSYVSKKYLSENQLIYNYTTNDYNEKKLPINSKSYRHSLFFSKLKYESVYTYEYF